MGGLWELPTREVTWSAEAAPGIHEARWPEVLTETGEVLAEGLRHSVTHHRIQGRVLEAQLAGEPGEGLCWAPLGELEQRGLTALSAKALSKSASAVARLRRSR
jgi:adenine-specific DNA glycosylase